MRARWVIVAVVLVLAAGGLYLQQRARMERAAKEAREAALRSTLSAMRTAIANFREDHGRHPHSLEELVPRYIRRIPPDPITQQTNWRLTTEETVQPSDDFSSSSAPKSESVILDVHSTAPGYGDY